MRPLGIVLAAALVVTTPGIRAQQANAALRIVVIEGEGAINIIPVSYTHLTLPTNREV